MDALGRFVADAVLGIDTIWGGDVMCPSGTGRFIADSWFSDEPLPAAYTVPAAARVREAGGVSGKNVDRQAVEEYLRQVELPQAIAGIRDEARKIDAGKPTVSAVSISKACRFAWRQCGTWPWKFSEKASRFRTSAVLSLRRAARRNHRTRQQSESVSLSCWAVQVTQPRVLPVFSGR